MIIISTTTSFLFDNHVDNHVDNHFDNHQVQSTLKAKSEDMLSSLDYLMHITYSLVLNPHINIVLYVSTWLGWVIVEMVLLTLYSFISFVLVFSRVVWEERFPSHQQRITGAYVN